MRKLLLVLIALTIALSVISLFSVRKGQPATSGPSKFVSEVNYQCRDGKSIKASYYQGPVATVKPGQPPIPSGEVNLLLSDGRGMILPQTISASGIRYGNKDESVVFWSKGDGAFITEGGVETYSDCVKK